MRLAIGDFVYGKLIEEIERDLWIVSISGSLFQVKNTSTLEFRKNKEVKLQVVKKNPLQLSILGLARKSFRSFNIRI